MKGSKKVLVGMLSAHVDDCFCTGKGKLFETKVVALRKAFPFGQWVRAKDHPIKYCGTTVI